MRLTTRMSGAVMLLLMAGFAVAQGPAASKAGGKRQPAKAAVVSAPAAPASAPAPAEPPRDVELERALLAYLERNFRLPADLAVDADLLSAAQEIASAHLARMKAQLPALIAQEQRSSKALLRTSELLLRIYANFINEFALMRLESTGPDFDAAWLAAALQPRFCDMGSSKAPFTDRIRMMQQVPKAQRAVALEGERLLLLRWGTPRQVLPQRPSPTVDEQVAVLVGRIKAGAARPAVAMVPILANVHMSASDEQPTDRWWQRCLSAQWWLRMQSLNSEAARTAALNGFRYATLLLGSDAIRPPGKLPVDSLDEYPQLASRWDAQGLLTLRLYLDAQGKLLRAEVIKREFSVPGVRDNPPVAFDTLLDAAALARAASGRFPKPKTIRIENGITLAEQEYQFALDRSTTDED